MKSFFFKKRFHQYLILSLFHTSLIAAEMINGPFSIVWNDESDNESGFCIEFKLVSDTVWTILDSTKTGLNMYGPINLKENRITMIRVYAFNEYGNSSYSDTLTVLNLGSSVPVKLSWPSFSENNLYNIYYNTSPFNDLSGDTLLAQSVTDSDALTPGIQWTDFSHSSEDTLHNHYYTITEVFELPLADSVYRIGCLSYELKRFENSGVNHLALPVLCPEINDARAFMDLIPGSISVATWQHDMQNYFYYNSSDETTNFSIRTGDTFIADVMNGGLWTVTGEIIPTEYQLVTTDLTNFNEIMMPMQVRNISSASQLMREIPWCNSVAFWDPAIQSYRQYIPNVPDSDFPVFSGYPYFIHVTRPVTWPSDSQPALSKMSAAKPLADHVPHTVLGYMDDESNNRIVLEAFISSRPDEKLTVPGPAIKIQDRLWTVQCAAFNTSWQIGDQFIIRARQDDQPPIELAVRLTADPADICDRTLHFSESLQKNIELLPAYPNPFNHSLTIHYNISSENHVNISIINLLGEKITKLVDQVQPKGHYEIKWNGRDNRDQPVASNIYFIVFKLKTETYKQKIILLQ